MENIVLHVTFTGAPGKAEAFARAMESSGLRQEVLSETGCMQYEYFVPVVGDGTQIVLLEKWRDQACLDAHTNGEPMRKLKELQVPYALEAKLEIFA